jgi:predicted site-specific integrase-resolvase
MTPVFTHDDWMRQPTVTIGQAALILGMSRATAYRAAKAGILPAIKVAPRRYVVSTTVLAELLHLNHDSEATTPTIDGSTP